MLAPDWGVYVRSKNEDVRVGSLSESSSSDRSGVAGNVVSRERPKPWDWRAAGELCSSEFWLSVSRLWRLLVKSTSGTPFAARL